MNPSNDASALNTLVNHPALRERTLFGFMGEVDFRSAIEKGEILFFGDGDGGFMLHNGGHQIWSAHTQFLPETDKRGIMPMIEEVKRWMFCRTDCLAITTFVEDDNKPALFLALRAGFRKIGRKQVFGRDGDELIFTVKDWARSLCQQSS